MPLQPFLSKLYLINYKINEKAKLALRIRLNPDNRHKDQRNVIAKKIPVVSYCTDARVEIRYVVQTHVFLFAFYRNCEIERSVFNFFARVLWIEFLIKTLKKTSTLINEM